MLVLKRADPVCAELYEHAVNALGTSPFSRGALVGASHCLRELGNRLPGVLGETPPHSGLSITSTASLLAGEWAKHRQHFAQAAQTGGAIPSESLRAVLEQVDAVVDVNEAISASVAKKQAAMVLGNSEDVKNSTVVSFRMALSYFEEFRHPQGGAEKWPTEVAEPMRHLEIIERVIEGRIGDFFQVAADLRLLMTQVNARDAQTGEWTVPPEELVLHAVSSIGSPQHRRIFFDELHNPRWVYELFKVGALDPPTPATPHDEYVRVYSPWTAGTYLARIASEAPDGVRDALLRAVDKSATYEVRHHVVEATKALPVSHVAVIGKALLKNNSTGPLDSMLGLGVAKLAERLALNGSHGSAGFLGKELLRPRQSEDAMAYPRAVAGIETSGYSEALKLFINGMSGYERLLPILAAWLSKALEAEGIDPQRGYDTSHYYRPSIAVGDEPSRDRIAEILIDPLRDLAINKILAGCDPNSVAELLGRSGYPLLRRIKRHVFARAVEHVPEALPVAQRCLMDVADLDGGATPCEYIELAQATLPLLDDAAYREWESLFLAGPTLRPDRLKDIQENLQPGQTVEEAWTRYVDQWLLEHLGTIGTAALRGKSRAKLTELEAKLGSPTDPSFGDVRVVRLEDNSDDLPQLRDRSIMEIIEYVREWVATTEDHLGTATYDVGDAFAIEVANRAQEFSTHAEDILFLPEPFPSQLLTGLRKAVDSNTPINWVKLLSALTALSDNEVANGDHFSDSRSQYQVLAALRLIESALSKSGSGFSQLHLDSAIDFTTRYVLAPGSHIDEPTSISDLRNDPLSEALNTVQSGAVLAAMKLAAFAKVRHAEDSDSLVERVLDALKTLLHPTRVPAPSLAATFGYKFNLLHQIAPQWLRSNADLLLSEDWYGDVVSSTALLHSNKVDSIFEILEPKLSSLISRAAHGETLEWDRTDNESVIHRIGIHLACMVFRGNLNLSHPLVNQFFSQTPATIRGSVLRNVGDLLGDSNALPSEMIAKAQELWDSRRLATEGSVEDAAEFSGFHTWVGSGHFPTDWWLPRLSEVADSIDLEGITYLGEHLATGSHTNPILSFTILKKLLERATKLWVRHDLIKHAPIVIARAISTGTPEINRSANDLMSNLGHQGVLDIPDLVQVALNDT